jgi:hypothetical protein
MDEKLGKMFRDKNKEIFLNSLDIDIKRNCDALKSTTDNCVSLEINKLYIFLNNFFKEQNIYFKKEEMLGMLYREKIELNKIINKKIEEKNNNLIDNYIDKFKDKEDIMSDFFEEVSKKIDEETEKMNNDLDYSIKSKICLEFSQSIIKKYSIKNEEQVERINSRINILFKDIIIKRVKEETKFRDDSLRNQIKTSYEKYRNLNENTYGKFAE